MNEKGNKEKQEKESNVSPWECFQSRMKLYGRKYHSQAIVSLMDGNVASLFAFVCIYLFHFNTQFQFTLDGMPIQQHSATTVQHPVVTLNNLSFFPIQTEALYQ
jgi:hypothetical protein